MENMLTKLCAGNNYTQYDLKNTGLVTHLPDETVVPQCVETYGVYPQQQTERVFSVVGAFCSLSYHRFLPGVHNQQGLFQSATPRLKQEIMTVNCLCFVNGGHIYLFKYQWVFVIPFMNLVFFCLSLHFFFQFFKPVPPYI